MPTTLTAKQLITTALQSGSIVVPNYIAFGTGDSEFNETDITLETETVRNIVSNIDKANTTIEWTGTLTEAQGNGTTIEEVGLFNASSSGDMFVREVVYPVNKTSAFEYDIVAVMRIK